LQVLLTALLLLILGTHFSHSLFHPPTFIPYHFGDDTESKLSKGEILSLHSLTEDEALLIPGIGRTLAFRLTSEKKRLSLLIEKHIRSREPKTPCYQPLLVLKGLGVKKAKMLAPYFGLC
jgi:hypothetical protein